MSKKNPLNGHPYNDIVPLYPRCYDLIIMLREIIENENKIDEKQNKTIKQILNILRTKADKEAVSLALAELASEMYENFYTKEEVDEKIKPFSAEVIDELPVDGEATKLYLVEDKESGGFHKFVFSSGSPISLGYTDCLNVHDFEDFLVHFEDILTDISKIFDDIDEKLQNVSSGATSAITEMHTIIINEVETILENYITYSALTEFRESILEEISEVLLDYVTKEEFVSGLTETFNSSTAFTVDYVSVVAEHLEDEFDEKIIDVYDEVSRVYEEILDIINSLATQTEEELDEIKEYVETLVQPVEVSILEDRIRVLEDKLERTMYKDLDNTVVQRNINSDKDLLITGVTDTSARITAPNVTLKDLVINNDARLTIVTDEEILLKNVNFEGDFGSRLGGLNVISLSSGEDVTIKNTFFNTPDTPIADTQNGIVLGLTRVPKNILIDNVDFSNKFKNHPLIIYGVQNDSVINISNVHFAKVKNCIRFSNSANATGVTINITNCSCDQWSPDDEWSGFMVFEDYTSSASEVETNNLFGDGKITVNVHNLKYQDEKIKTPENIADVCGTEVYPTQLFYMYATKIDEFIKYDETRWPKINIV